MTVIGIRQEDKSIWERRTPLIPEHVKQLADQGVRFVVQRSENRCYADTDFANAGAELVDDVNVADVILGVKEVPVDKIARGKTYLIFSHTMKGQPYNMPLLRRILDLGCTLLDYELVTNAAGLRTIAFGRHAGLAGAIDTLFALGQRLAQRGINTPLAELKSALHYGSVDAARQAIETAGRRIAQSGLPAEISPLAIGVTGENGKVWGGAMEVLGFLPARQVEAEELAPRAMEFAGRAHEIWAVSYDPRDLVEPIDKAQEYSWQDYTTHPDKYRACFAPHLQHLTAVIHAIFWAPGYPRFLVAKDIKELLASKSNARLDLITDITCDPGGSNELLLRVTEPGNPAYVWDATSGRTTEGLAGAGIALWAVDILPAEIPMDASRHFSEVLTPLIPHLAHPHLKRRPDDPAFAPELHRAFIASEGKLTPEWQQVLAAPLQQHGGPAAREATGQ